MASANKNTLIPSGAVVPTLITKLTRGKNINLGSIAVAGDVVSFTVPEPSRDHQGALIIQVGPGNIVIGAGTLALEVSTDDGASWVTFPTVTTTGVVAIYAITGQPGGDTAAVFSAQYNVSGFGSGARFKFGFVASPTSGTGPVWALVG